MQSQTLPSLLRAAEEGEEARKGSRRKVAQKGARRKAFISKAKVPPESESVRVKRKSIIRRDHARRERSFLMP